MNSAVSSLANGASAVALGAYLAAVIYQGNAAAFADEAKTDWQYLEFLLALIALKILVDLPYVGEVAFWFVAMALVALAIKIVSDRATVSALKEFGSGDAGMFETVMKIFG